MFKYIIFVILTILFFCTKSNAQSKNDTIFSKSSLGFSKVKPYFKKDDTVFMNVNYVIDKHIFLLKFNVRSFWFRANTTLNDYCLIETKKNKFRFQNQVENPVFGESNDFYRFSLNISKDSLLSILNKGIKKITFYFIPNPKISEYLKENKNELNNYLLKYTLKISTKTLKIKVSKPNKNQNDELIKELQKLNI